MIMKKNYILHFFTTILGFVIGSIIAKNLIERVERKQIELDKDFDNEEFDLSSNYIRKMAYSYKRKANRAKIGKKKNDVKKNTFLYRLLLDYAKDAERLELKQQSNRKWIVLSRKELN